MTEVTNAEIGYGTLVKVRTSTGPDVYTTIGQQFDVSGGGFTVEMADGTHNESPEATREKVAGLAEEKPYAFSINLVPGGSVESLVRSLKRVLSVFRTVHPDGAYHQYEGYITDFEAASPTDDRITGSVEITPAGVVTPYQASAPTNSVKPAISGTVQVGQTLTAFPGVWANEPTAFTYVWKNEGVAIDGATAKTYVLQAGDQGDNITVTVTGTNSAGNASATSAETVAVAAA